ncbi:hypothetical protein ANN_11132 [Periplaneta americana]|uniref:Uncharacterized protein n=1 Tax=Periplaneta americana TaxID=6978 RepID=A0ABQ8T4W3_PERAM|nr:hypothetical protein ANN_11132 [Periplaneta americana]
MGVFFSFYKKYTTHQCLQAGGGRMKGTRHIRIRIGEKDTIPKRERPEKKKKRFLICSRHLKDFNFHAPPSNHVRVSSTNFIQRSSKYNIKNNENNVTAAVIGSSERAPTFRLLSRSRNIPCATRYCKPATAGQVSSSDSEHCYFGTEGSDLLFIFATVPRPQQYSASSCDERVMERRKILSGACVDFGPAFIDIYDVVQRAATRGNPRASKAIGLEVNPEKTKYMIMSRDKNIVRNGNIKIGDLCFEEVEKFKYLGATVTNINDTREEIKRRINMGNACYYSVEKLLSSSLLSKNLKVRIHKTVIGLLPVFLYGCETWTLTLREEHRLRVFENKVLRKIFGAKRDEITGEWRKLHNAELHSLYSSHDIIRNIKSRRLRWAGHVARMGESRNPYRVLVGRPEGKRPLGRPRCRWEDNIKMDLREVGYDDRDWINLAQDRDRWRAYVRAAMNLRVP